MINTDFVHLWALSAFHQAKSESVHSNGQSKTKATSQLLEPRNDKVGQQRVSHSVMSHKVESWSHIKLDYIETCLDVCMAVLTLQLGRDYYPNPKKV